MKVTHADPRQMGSQIWETTFWIEMNINGKKVESRPYARKFEVESMNDIVAARQAARALDAQYEAAIAGLTPKEASAKLAELVFA